MSPFLSLIASKFDALHLELEPLGGAAIRRGNTDGPKMGLEVHTKAHLALVEAWEHEHCLDITLMDRKSGLSSILSAGPCGTLEEATARIVAFRDHLLA